MKGCHHIRKAFLLLSLAGMLLSCTKVPPGDNGPQTPSNIYLETDLSNPEYPEPEAVDLGLRVKWASFNLGASREYETGYYFAWGETVPRNDFGWSVYPFSNDSGNGFSKYCYDSAAKWWTGQGEPDGLVELEPEDDAVHVNLGGKWRMPTRWDLWELDDFIWSGKGQLRYETVKDPSGREVRGCRITDTRSGNSIFLPSVGRVEGRIIESYGTYCYYWTSSLTRGGIHGPAGGYFIGLDGVGEHLNEWTCGRFYGMPIRPVCD